MKAPASIRRIVVIAILSVFIAMFISVLGRASLSQIGRRDTRGTTSSQYLSPIEAGVRAGVKKRYGQLPMRFEENRGQTDPTVRFLARGDGYSLFLTANEAVWRFRKPGKEANPKTETHPLNSNLEKLPSALLRMRLAGANPEPKVTGIDPLSTKSNYFLGADPQAWRAGVPNFARVKYESVYPGIDLIWYGAQQQFEHDFIVSPGADARRIRLAFSEASMMSLDPQGDLILEVDGEQARMLKPAAWQELGGKRIPIDCRYRLKRSGQIGFELGRYDHEKPLVIDPILIYSTHIGGVGSETGRGVAVDQNGNAYVVGETTSVDFPVVNPLQPQPGAASNADIFVLKINPAGSALVYATYLGGNSADVAYAVVAGADGAAYLTGYTFSTNFPTTVGAPQPSRPGGSDAFITKINPAGSALVYSTYLGGASLDRGHGIALNASEEAYITGYSDSTNLPASGFQQTRSGNSFYKSANRGGDWSGSDNGLLSSLIYTLAVHPTDADVVYAGASDGVYKTTDGGSVWRRSANFNATQGVAVDPKNPTTVFAATNFALYKSVDAGATWQQKTAGIISAFQFFTVAFDPVTTATVYIGTDRGVFKSVNGGENFSVASTGLGQGSLPGQPPTVRVSSLVVDPTNPMILYAATNQGMFKTLDGGGLWTSINNGISAFSTILALAIDPATPTTLYLSLSVSSLASSLYKSTDGGNSWLASGNGLSSKFGSLDIYQTVYSIAVDPTSSSIVYAGTLSGGVFKSTDGGGTWTASNTGLNNVYIRSLAVAPQNASTVYAGIFGGPDGFVAKLNAAGTALDYLTYLGGYESDYGLGIAVDKDGAAFVAGQTDSTNFPVAGALQPVKSLSGPDAFVAKVNPTGTALVYSTYLGGTGTDFAQCIAIDASGSAYIAGGALSTNFPTRNPLQPVYAGGIYDAFAAKLNPAGSALVYSTYLGGNDQEIATGIAVDGGGAAYIVGGTLSTNFPLIDSVQQQYGGGTDAFLAKINPIGSALVYSTFLGGSRNDVANAVAVDRTGNAYITGATSSLDWPTVGPLQQLRGSSDLFIAKLGVEADLAITKTASRNPVMAGANLTYTLTVANAGPSPATGVVVTDPLPGGVSFVSASSTKGSCSANAGVMTCNLGDLALKATAVVSLVVTPTTAGVVSNTASVQGNEPENNQINNQATAEITVSNLPSIAGRVTAAGGQGLSGVTVALGGGQVTTRQTDANGFYQFTDLTIGGGYTVTPARDSYSFEPELRNFPNLSSDQTADFTASVCSYSIAPAGQSFEAGGGGGVINVAGTSRCPWTAVSNVDWIRITSVASGAGNGVVNFTVLPTIAPRNGRISVAGQSFAVYQSVAVCATPQWRENRYFLGPTFGSNEGGPARIVVTDFNGDDKRDLITLSNLNRAVLDPYRLLTILAGDGQEGYTSLLALRLPGTVLTLAVDDFNGDGRPDIVDLNNTAVEIRLNDGQGGLAPPTSYPFTPIVQFRSPGILTGDFNRDGKVDLLLYADDSFNRTANVRILLNNGSGGLNAPINISLSDHITLGLTDVNADGVLDLLTYRQTPSGTTVNRELLLYPGDGAGSFGPPLSSPVSNLPSKAAFGDFNGDGKTDVAFYLTDFDSNPASSVALLLGDGSGRFGSPANLNLPADARTTPAAMLAMDLNGDGKTDLLVKGFGPMFLFPGDGAGKLGAPVNQGNNGALDIATADLDGDGKLDLALINGISGGNQAQVFFNRCGAGPAIFGQAVEGASPFGVAGVAVKLAGPSGFTMQTQTDAGGNYSFRTGLTPGASYTVTVERPFYRFIPDIKTVGALTSDQIVNFSAVRIATAVSAASFRGDSIAPESIAAVFGEGISSERLTATTSPLPTQLGSVSARIKDANGAERPVRLFYISPKQVNVLIPPGLAVGAAVLTITQFNSTSFPQITVADLRIENVAPGLFSMDGSGAGLPAAVVLRVKADGSQVIEPVARFDATQQRLVAVPIDLSNPAEQVFLIPYGTGVRNRSALSAVTAKIGGLDAEVTFAGAVESLSGVDQFNLRIPRSLAGRGDVDVVVVADGRTANTVRVNVK